MERIKHTTSYPTLPDPSTDVSGSAGYFHPGSPAGGIASTWLTAAWCNSVQESIVNPIEDSGQTLDITASDQLSRAISTYAGRRNMIINGMFSVWQRGTSLASGTGKRYLADCWFNESVGTTYTASRQAFTAATTIVERPGYFHRTVVTSVTAAGNYCRLVQPLESVFKHSNRTMTVSFWAKTTTASKNICVAFEQQFGSGGSAAVSGIGATTIALTTAWQQFFVTVSAPSVDGKTIGTGNYLGLVFYFDAGSDLNSITNTLGQQSGTFDIANVFMVSGSTKPSSFYEVLSETIAKCLRYYQNSFAIDTTPAQNVAAGAVRGLQIVGATTATEWVTSIALPSRLRATGGTVTLYNPAAASAEVRNVTRSNNCTASAGTATETHVNITLTTSTGSAAGDVLSVHYAVDASL